MRSVHFQILEGAGSTTERFFFAWYLRRKFFKESAMEKCLKTPEAASYLGLSIASLERDRCKSGKHEIPCHRVLSRTIVYDQDELEAYLATRKIRSTTPQPRENSGPGSVGIPSLGDMLLSQHNGRSQTKMPATVAGVRDHG